MVLFWQPVGATEQIVAPALEACQSYSLVACETAVLVLLDWSLRLVRFKVHRWLTA